jgi:hypothetical protein
MRRGVLSVDTGLGTSAPLAAAALVALGVELVVIGGCALVIREVADRCSDLDVMVATARREYRELVGRATGVRVAGVPVPVAAVADVLRLRVEFGGVDDGQ